MKLHLSSRTQENIFTAYGDGYVQVQNRTFTGNIIVSPDTLIDPWPAAGFDGLVPEDFDAVLALQPQVILLGTGRSLRFPHPRVLRSVMQAHVGLESMDTLAACRTYNILAGEGRKVVAALLFDK